MEKLKGIPASEVALVLADPPYGLTQCYWDQPLPLELLWQELERVCKGNAQILMFGIENQQKIVENIKLHRIQMVRFPVSGGKPYQKCDTVDYL